MNKLVNWAYAKRANYYANKLLPHIQKSQKVLDVGAGSGFLSERLSQHANITLVDTVNYNQTKLPLVLYDGHGLPFENNSFDVGLLITVLHHTPDPPKVLREVQRVCKKIVVIEETYNSKLGKFFISSWDWFWNKSTGIDTFYNFKSSKEWIKVFDELNLKTTSNELGTNFLRNIKMSIFVLESTSIISD